MADLTCASRAIARSTIRATEDALAGQIAFDVDELEREFEFMIYNVLLRNTGVDPMAKKREGVNRIVDLQDAITESANKKAAECAKVVAAIINNALSESHGVIDELIGGREAIAVVQEDLEQKIIAAVVPMYLDSLSRKLNAKLADLLN